MKDEDAGAGRHQEDAGGAGAGPGRAGQVIIRTLTILHPLASQMWQSEQIRVGLYTTKNGFSTRLVKRSLFSASRRL